MIIIKIGGGKTINLNGIVSDLSRLKDKFIIVHGANGTRDRLYKIFGWEKKVITSLSGYESVYSDEKSIKLLIMAYAGLQNKKIVELCHQKGIKAIGLCGLDGALIRGKRNKGIRVKEGNKIRIVRDFSGKPETLNIELLSLLLKKGYVPVITVPIIDEANRAINTENDDVVTLIYRSFRAQKIIYLIEAPGILKNPSDPGSIIPFLPPREIEKLEKNAQGRFKRKLLAIRRILDIGNPEIIITDGRVERPVLNALTSIGTVIKNETFSRA